LVYTLYASLFLYIQKLVEKLPRKLRKGFVLLFGYEKQSLVKRWGQKQGRSNHDGSIAHATYSVNTAQIHTWLVGERVEPKRFFNGG
jgi:hypothetical protein